jgi:hypothetical protein
VTVSVPAKLATPPPAPGVELQDRAQPLTVIVPSFWMAPPAPMAKARTELPDRQVPRVCQPWHT